ncbi:alpha/beta hydrolase-fold protein [Planctomicrobium piriforme]|uniref:Putative esterase n=1 Tax=Planctomicrobium piriforme TaxID=1576369 RepID=A0A1I3S8P1_9PLAN|nr:alpha/beta hydrolase-fold protein [Planctomicrobium piriforme]SFJ55065.1 Putative esterase [Planctomicrobium piriforme]
MWTSLQIAGRPADVFVPKDRTAAPGAVIFLHGHAAESLGTHEAFTRAFETWQLPVVCPMIPGCWWLDRVMPQFDAVQTPLDYVTTSIVDWVRTEWGIEPPHVALLGVSTGGQGVLQIAYRQAMRYPVVAAISPAIDFDRIYGRGFGVEDLFPDAETARQETAVLRIHPLNWPKAQFFCSDPLDANWHEGAQRLSSKLSSSGILHTSDLTTSHGGHGWPYFEAMAETAVAFVAKGLKRV